MNVEMAGEQLAEIFECGRRAGIEHAMFINFGTLLGYVRDKSIIAHDDDTDVSVRSDWITKEQEDAFHDELVKADMFMYRRRHARRKDTNRLLWLSLKSDPRCCKSCIWFDFPWKMHMYHCKGGRWLKKIGAKPEVKRILPNSGTTLHEYETIMKGNTIGYFDKLSPISFYGVKMRIPFMARSLLDEYYENWAIPKRGGASVKHYIVLIKKWDDDSSWMVLK